MWPTPAKPSIIIAQVEGSGINFLAALRLGELSGGGFLHGSLAQTGGTNSREFISLASREGFGGFQGAIAVSLVWPNASVRNVVQ